MSIIIDKDDFDINYYLYQNIGDKFTIEELCNKIKIGSFSRLTIGSYFDITINTSYTANEKVRCVIADVDPYYNTGKENSLNFHHVVIIPEDCFETTEQIQAKYTSAWSYLQSYAYTQWLPVYQNALENVFSSHLLGRTVFLATKGGSSAGAGSEGTWYTNRKLELMSEMEIFGKRNYANIGEYSDIETQFKIFELNPDFIKAGRGYMKQNGDTQYYWEKDPHYRNSSAPGCFCVVDTDGSAYYNGADAIGGVRPCFIIG